MIPDRQQGRNWYWQVRWYVFFNQMYIIYMKFSIIITLMLSRKKIECFSIISKSNSLHLFHLLTMSSRTCALNIALYIRVFLITFYLISSLSWLVLLIQNISIKWKITYCILNIYRYSASNCSQIKKNQLTTFHPSGLRNHYDWDFSKLKLYSIMYM